MQLLTSPMGQPWPSWWTLSRKKQHYLKLVSNQLGRLCLEITNRTVAKLHGGSEWSDDLLDLAAEIPAHYLPTAIVFLQSSPIRSGRGSTVTALDFHRENLGLCPAGRRNYSRIPECPALQQPPLTMEWEHDVECVRVLVCCRLLKIRK